MESRIVGLFMYDELESGCAIGYFKRLLKS
jgi:hypothetical protein